MRIEMYLFSTVLLLVVIWNHAANTQKLVTHPLDHLTGILPNISLPPLIPATPQKRCFRMQCKYVCFNGRSNNISKDVNAVVDTECQSIDELHLFNYEFPQQTIPAQLLGSISDLVKHLFIYSSNVVTIEEAAFKSQSLIGVNLENLKLNNIHKGIFRNVSQKFTTFNLVQTEPPLESVDESFLEYVKYQIKKLTIKTGLVTVKNLTNSGCLLNSLEEVNLSYNNFGSTLDSDSFKQLSMIEVLNLTRSGITSLSDSIFSANLGTLKSLDLSHNNLLTISQGIFGWRDSKPKGLTIYLNDNPWDCDCELQKQMLSILIYQTEPVYCGSPQGDILVTNEALCLSNELNNDTSCSDSSELDGESCGSSGGSAPIPIAPVAPISEEDLETELTTATETPLSTTDSYGLASLECKTERGSTETYNFPIEWPSGQFKIVEKEGFAVDIVVRPNLNGSYGILWFSRVTTQYFEMENNYHAYGLGCYGILEYITTVEDLLPDTSYTFCLVMKDQLTVSPFSCNSVYIGGNLDVKYNAWLTTNMKAAGISLIVLGIVLFKFLGIIFVFLLIKQKPTLVKGSKRVVMQKSDTTNIIVFPEDTTLEKFKLMEQQIAKRNSRGASFRRLSSVSSTSIDSNQSYMNAASSNMYEVIPAYQRYLPTFSDEYGADVNYAEIPIRCKRTSTDPLPAVPVILPSSPAMMLKKLEINRDYLYDLEGSSV